MPNIQEKDGGFLSKIVSLLKQFPWVAFCLWMGYRDITREASLEKREKDQVDREIDRETFYRSQLLYQREQIEKQNAVKEQKLNELNTQDGKATIE